jgi:hypothetical protein
MISYCLRMEFQDDNPPTSTITVSYTLRIGMKCIHIAKMTKFVNINDMSMISNKEKRSYLFFHAPTRLISSSVKLKNYKVIIDSLFCWILQIPQLNQQTMMQDKPF